MNLQELLRDPSLDSQKISEMINYTYFKSFHGHDNMDWVEVIDRMKSIDLQPNELPTRFTMEEVYEDHVLYYDVNCLVDDKEAYDVSLTPWRETLSYDIHQLVIEYVLTGKMTREQLVGHVIAEMTFYGLYVDSIDNMIRHLRTPQESVELKDLPMVELDEEDRYIPLSQRETKEEE